MLKRLFQSDFNKSVLTLLTGTTIASAIPIAISPILTRMYTPEDFGVLALFVAITSILGSIANGRYELAIVLPEKDGDAINLVALSIWIAFVFSGVLMGGVILFHDEIVSILDNDQISPWLYVVPIVVFLIGVFNALNYLNTRMKTYKTIAVVNVYRSLTTALVQIVLGVFKAGASGLITGQVAANFVSNTKLASSLLKDKSLISYISKDKMKAIGEKYISFPKYSMWAVLANSLSQNLLSFFLPLMYTVSALGQYSLVQRVLGTPSSIIGSSVGQVFFQKASAERRECGNAKGIFLSTFKKLFLISILPFSILFFFAEPIIVFVFGPEWHIAGEYSKILAPYFMLRFINTPLSTITSVFEKNHIALRMQVSYLTITIFVLSISYFLNLEIKEFLVMYSGVFSLYNFVRIFIFYRISLGETYNAH